MWSVRIRTVLCLSLIHILKKVAEVEALCFPAAEAAGYEDFMERYKTCKNSFFVAETEDGEIAGFCNGCCADTDYLADALYHDATLHNPDGDYQMIFGLDVNPKFQNCLLYTSESRGTSGFRFLRRPGYQRKTLESSVLRV